jgi:peptide/nickel transport system ATP-binding protein
MRRGRMVERGEVLSVFSNPFTDYTRDLLAAVPDPAGRHSPPARPAGRSRDQPPRHLFERAPPSPPRAALDGTPAAAMVFDRVEAQYPGRLGRRPFTALRDVSITVDRDEILGVVGESGSGKTTIARVRRAGYR